MHLLSTSYSVYLIGNVAHMLWANYTITHSLTSRPSSMTSWRLQMTTLLSFFSTAPRLVTYPSAECTCSYNHSILLCRPSIVFWVFLGDDFNAPYVNEFTYSNYQTLCSTIFLFIFNLSPSLPVNHCILLSYFQLLISILSTSFHHRVVNTISLIIPPVSHITYAVLAGT